MRLPQIPFQKKLSSATTDTIVPWLEDLYKGAESVRRAHEDDWCSNACFLAGRQVEAALSDFNKWGRKADVPASRKPEIVTNRILVLVRQAAAMLTSNFSGHVAIAATTEEADVQAAEIATDFLRGRYFDDNEKQIRLHEVLWDMVAGRTYRKTYWDSDKFAKDWNGQMAQIGDVASVMLNPWRVLTSPHDDCMTEPEWVIEADVRDISEVNDLYPGKDVASEEYADVSGKLDRLLVGLVEGKDSGAAPKKENAVILKRCSIKPDARNPKGLYYVWANGVLLDENVLPEDDITITNIDWFPVPGSKFPLPFITPLRDAQLQINKTNTQLNDVKDKQLNGDIVVQGPGEVTQEFVKKQAGVVGDQPVYRNTKQRIIRVPNNATFQFMKYDFNTAHAKDLQAMAWDYMMDGAGIRETTLGKGGTSGTTLGEVLARKEADAAGMELFTQNMDEVAYPRISQHKLMVMKKHGTVGRMTKVFGKAKLDKVVRFFGSDFRNTEDVVAKPMPSLTEAQKLQVRAQAAQMGLFDLTGTANAKMSKVKALRSLGLTDIEEEIEGMLGMSVEELEAECAQQNQMEILLGRKSLEGQLAQIQAAEQQQAQAQEQAQAPEEDADPMEQVMAMMQGGGKGLHMVQGGAQ